MGPGGPGGQGHCPGEKEPGWPSLTVLVTCGSSNCCRIIFPIVTCAVKLVVSYAGNYKCASNDPAGKKSHGERVTSILIDIYLLQGDLLLTIIPVIKAASAVYLHLSLHFCSPLWSLHHG